MNHWSDSAFPTPHFVAPNGDIQWGAPGLTIREHFAALALNSVARDLDQGAPSVAQISLELGIEPSSYRYDPHWEQFVAKRVVRRADALIAELAKPVQP